MCETPFHILTSQLAQPLPAITFDPTTISIDRMFACRGLATPFATPTILSLGNVTANPDFRAPHQSVRTVVTFVRNHVCDLRSTVCKLQVSQRETSTLEVSMKRSRNLTAVGVACLVLGTMGCGEAPIAPLASASNPASTGPAALLVTNNTREDVEVMVEFGTELVALGLVEAKSSEVRPDRRRAPVWRIRSHLGGADRRQRHPMVRRGVGDLGHNGGSDDRARRCPHLIEALGSGR